MKITWLLLSLSFLCACGKILHSKTEPESKPGKAVNIPLDQWSGRSDYVDPRWRIKSQP
jgi:hypothetical protein